MLDHRLPDRGAYGVTFADDEKRILKGLAEVLEQFQELRANLPLHQLIIMLRLSLDEGKSQKHYAQALGLPPSTVSRAMLDLGKRMRHGEEGLGLIEERTAAHSLREHEMFISTKGKAMLRSAIKKLRGK